MSEFRGLLEHQNNPAVSVFRVLKLTLYQRRKCSGVWGPRMAMSNISQHWKQGSVIAYLEGLGFSSMNCQLTILQKAKALFSSYLKNQLTRKLISTQNTLHKYLNKDPSHLL